VDARDPALLEGALDRLLSHAEKAKQDLGMQSYNPLRIAGEMTNAFGGDRIREVIKRFDQGLVLNRFRPSRNRSLANASPAPEIRLAASAAFA
jgi:hypothetical protein